MEKNEERLGVVCSLGSNGEGIVKEDGFVVFVPFSLPQEKIRYKIVKVAKGYAFGKLLEVLTPSEIRVRPACPVFTKCGGCDLQHVKYSEQLKIKESTITNCFDKIANIKVDCKPTVKGDGEFGYRNKLSLPVSQTDKGTVIGFYAENSHRVVPISDCLINASWTKTVIYCFNKFFSENNISGYDELNKTGIVREITVKDVRGSLIITVVTLTDNLPKCDNLVKILDENLKFEYSLYINVNKSTGNGIYGDVFRLVKGKPGYTAEMLGIKYKIGVMSFMQVNYSVCAKLYSAVKSNADIDSNTTVIDAYSGAGLMTALLSKDAYKGIGIEIVKEAVDCANDLCELNGLKDKVKNYVGKCEELLPSIIEQEKKQGRKISLIIDPPRKGCEYKVIDAIIKSDIDKIVYVSCMPSTLARDVGLICGTLIKDGENIVKAKEPKNTYKVTLVKPFDMFCQTKHVETLCVLEKN